jgi:hypothetical protein
MVFRVLMVQARWASLHIGKDGIDMRRVVSALSLLAIALSPGVSDAAEFVEVAGTVSMEAENFSARDNSGSPNWQLGSSGFGGVAGDGFMEATPNFNLGNGGAEVLLPPYLDYTFTIATAGTYRLHLRFDAPADDLGSDSLFVTLAEGGDYYRFSKQEDDVTLRAGGVDGSFATDPWQDVGLRNSDIPFSNPDSALFSLGPGSHTLRVTFREDGVALDKLVLRLDGMAAPVGEGPAETVANRVPSMAPLARMILIGFLALVPLCWAGTGTRGWGR